MVAMLEQCCNHSKQCRNNVVTLCWAENRRCESSRVTSPLDFLKVVRLVFWSGVVGPGSLALRAHCRATCSKARLVSKSTSPSSSETRGQIKGVRESLNGWKNIYGTKKLFWHQSEARTAATVWNWSGKTLSPGALLAVLYFSSCHIFRPFRLSLVPTISPWVSEDASPLEIGAAQLRSVREIAPKPVSLCVNRSHIRYGFRAVVKAIRYSEHSLRK